MRRFSKWLCLLMAVALMTPSMAMAAGLTGGSGQLFEVQIYRLSAQVLSERICENEPTGGVLLGGIYPVLPKITGL